MKHIFTFLFISFFSCSAGAAAFSEQGDAGELLTTAQRPVGTGSLDTISGTLINLDTGGGQTDDIDLFRIVIDDPSVFSVTVSATLSGDNDAQMYLFNAAGAQVAFDDDGGTGSLPQFNAGDIAGPSGIYYLAFNLFRARPLFTAGSLSGWSRSPDPFQTGDYSLALTGATAIPVVTTPTATPQNIPVFGPFGLLMMLLGLLWFGKGRSFQRSQ